MKKIGSDPGYYTRKTYSPLVPRKPAEKKRSLGLAGEGAVKDAANGQSSERADGKLNNEGLYRLT